MNSREVAADSLAASVLVAPVVGPFNASRPPPLDVSVDPGGEIDADNLQSAFSARVVIDNDDNDDLQSAFSARVVIDSDDNDNQHRPRMTVHDRVRELVRDAPLVEGVAVPIIGSSAAPKQQGGAKEMFLRHLMEIISALIIAAAVGGTVAALMARKGGDDDAVSPSLSSLPTPMRGQTGNPTPSPQTDKPTSFRFQEIRRAVTHHSSEEDLSNPRSPQSRALVWLSDSDRRQLNPNDREALVQRYALAVFFHATEGDGWYNNTGWLTGSHECGWFGTYCHSPTSCGQDCYDVPALTTLSISMGKSASGPFSGFLIVHLLW